MLNVTIYGKPSYNFEYLKSLLIKESKNAGIDVKLNEVTETSEFISNQVFRIPAIKINNELRCSNENDIVNFGKEVSKWLLSTENYGHLKKIIVPVDLKNNTESAIKYAIKLAEKLNGMIQLVHVFHPVPKSNDEIDDVYINQEQTKRSKLNNLTSKYNEILDDSKSPILLETKFLIGGAAERLIEISKRENTIIVMENVSDSNPLKKLFGSVSTKVASDAHCPVLIIPKDYKFRSTNKIAYCSSTESRDAAIYPRLIEMARAQNSELHILHFKDGKIFNEEINLELWKSFYPSELIHFQNLDGENFKDQIENYCIANTIDVLSMSTELRPLINSIFHKSVTKKMITNTKIPLLIFHKT